MISHISFLNYNKTLHLNILHKKHNISCLTLHKNGHKQLLNISKLEEINEMLRRYWHETGVWITGCAGVSCILKNEGQKKVSYLSIPTIAPPLPM